MPYNFTVPRLPLSSATAQLSGDWKSWPVGSHSLKLGHLVRKIRSRHLLPERLAGKLLEADIVVSTRDYKFIATMDALEFYKVSFHLLLPYQLILLRLLL